MKKLISIIQNIKSAACTGNAGAKVYANQNIKSAVTEIMCSPNTDNINKLNQLVKNSPGCLNHC